MAYSEANIVGQPVLKESGTHLVINWTSTDPAGTVFQCYINEVLAWHGTARKAVFPRPRSKVTIHVGAVGATEGGTDFSSSLSGGEPPDRVTLSWLGGAFLGGTAGLVAFDIYGSDAPGEPIDYGHYGFGVGGFGDGGFGLASAPTVAGAGNALATVPATVAGVDLSGFGIGGFGQGGFGSSANSYTWVSQRLTTGVWQFAVVPVDAANNPAGSPSTYTATVAAAPRPPAPNAAGLRLTYSYNPSTRVPTLSWLASPP